MSQAVTVELPEDVYEHLKRAAEDLGQPLEEIVTQAVEAGMPPSVADLPPPEREAFAAMARQSDEELREIAEASLPADKQQQLTRLLRKQQAGPLTGEERQTLDALHEEAEALTLRKAHAYALLKWRRQRLPTWDDLHRG